MRRPEVIIIGAGAAGLAAAAKLSAAGVRTLVLEARTRLGGRICTVADVIFPVPVEMGAEFIHGRPEATWRLVHEAGLMAYDIPFAHWRHAGGRLSRIENFEEAIAPVMRDLSRLRRDTTFAEYLRRSKSGRRFAESRRMAVDFVQGFDAADPERISAKSLAKEQEGLGDVGGETQFRLVAGYGALIEHLRRKLDRQRVSVRLSTEVTEIRWSRGRVEVVCRAGSRNRRRSVTVRAGRAIITLPLGVLQREAETAGAVRFVPDIASHRRACTRLASGPIVKVIAKFREAFWETREAARAVHATDELREAVFLHDTGAAFPTWWTTRPLRTSVLTGWAGGPIAARLSGRSKSEIVTTAIDSLASLFRRRASTIEPLIERMHVTDWEADPFARGAYSYELIGGAAARRFLAEPIDRTLFFAGEATDTKGQASTVAGAIASGERAAEEVIAAR